MSANGQQSRPPSRIFNNQSGIIKRPRRKFRTESLDEEAVRLKLRGFVMFVNESRKVISGRKDNFRRQFLRPETPERTLLPFDVVPQAAGLFCLPAQDRDSGSYFTKVIDTRKAGPGQHQRKDFPSMRASFASTARAGMC